MRQTKAEGTRPPRKLGGFARRGPTPCKRAQSSQGKLATRSKPKNKADAEKGRRKSQRPPAHIYLPSQPCFPRMEGRWSGHTPTGLSVYAPTRGYMRQHHMLADCIRLREMLLSFLSSNLSDFLPECLFQTRNACMDLPHDMPTQSGAGADHDIWLIAASAEYARIGFSRYRSFVGCEMSHTSACLSSAFCRRQKTQRVNHTMILRTGH